MTIENTQESILHLSGEILRGDSEKLSKSLPKDINTHLFWEISSIGGDLKEASSMCIQIASLYSTVTALEKVHSSAIMPYLAAAEKYAKKQSIFYFHHLRNDEDQNEELLREQEVSFIRYIDLQTRMGEKKIVDLMDNEARVTAKEAITLGIVHEII